MIIWINGCFGVGKTETAEKLHGLLKNSHIYDPEQVGAFLWDNAPKELKRKGDFQDIGLWRKINREYLKYLYDNYDGHIIVPMTLVNPEYYRDIIGKLREDGAEIRHFILCAPKEEITRRLMQRGEAENSWAEQQIERCISAFGGAICGEIIDTTEISSEEAANLIMKKCFADVKI